MVKSPLVSILVVNWNGGSVFKECLQSLKEVNYKNFELIVVDNASTDNSLSYVKKFFPKARLIKNKKNLGFAPANNQAYRNSKGEYVLLLNNDTKVTSSFLSLMVSRMEKDKTIGVLQPKIFMWDSPQHLDNAGSFLNSIGFSNHWGFGEKDRKEFNNERDVFSAKGACMLIRKEILEKIGLFDESFHSYYEESDFCWRVWVAGWRVLYFPKAQIFHKIGFSSRRMSAIEMNYYSLRNRISSIYKNFSLGNLIIYLPVHLFFLIGLGTYYILRFQAEKASMVFRAIGWNLKNINALNLKRGTVQKSRALPDSKLLPIIMQKTDFAHLVTHFKKVEKNF